MILRFPKIALQNKITNKTWSTKNQENSAHRFGDNYLTNHLIKFLQDRMKSWGVGALRVCTGYHFFYSSYVKSFPWNVWRHSPECLTLFSGMLGNIPRNVSKHSGECCQKLRGMSWNIPGNIAKHSGQCPQTFWRMLPNIPGNIANFRCKWR